METEARRDPATDFNHRDTRKRSVILFIYLRSIEIDRELPFAGTFYKFMQQLRLDQALGAISYMGVKDPTT